IVQGNTIIVLKGGSSRAHDISDDDTIARSVVSYDADSAWRALEGSPKTKNNVTSFIFNHVFNTSMMN
ncbi:MAG: hypothetical protein IJ191_07780, partial [Treponema sp.]|nr:hypothetical protein [Treponema sp.]